MQEFRYVPEIFCRAQDLMQDALDTLGYIYRQKNNNYSSVAIVCDEQTTEEVLKYMCTLFEVSELEFHIDYIDYDKEDYFDFYGVILYIENSKLHMGIENAHGGTRYKAFEVDYLYVDNNIDECFLNCQSLCECKIDKFIYA